ncbi:ShlB/FhaC/HecB family hemolysin secretion/activation protein [Magnetospirillum sp. 15-1]|uniref:ShlB/FhaC/HecB family hemolysin secretion/activation protein n=1 Tax=Magnetospirillum sp. 15-1 TaxID=1979370 RepID=UPI000BBBAC39|nr:ShlB/FhaC/HecB family hemolysin secretion/activation protein [Magnetospirillum sp. 15-1]
MRGTVQRSGYVLALLAMASPVWAQSALPGGVDPAQIERQFKPPEQPLSGGDGVRPPQRPPVEMPEGAEAATFVLRGFEIEGATVFDPRDFVSEYERLIGTEVSVRTLYEVAAAITARYVAAGYVLSQAVVPPQQIGKDGIARLRVVEGYVDRTIIRGGAHGRDGLLRAYGERIRAERPLTLKTLERYLLLASDLPGASVSGTLTPSATVPGAADLIFEIDHKPVDAHAALDNRGSRYVGPWQGIAGVNLNSPMGLNERTGLLYAFSPFQWEKLKYGRVSHEETLNEEGTRLGLDAGLISAHPGHTLKDLAVRSRSTSLGLTLGHALIRSRAENLGLQGRLEARDTATFQYGDSLIAKDALRTVRLGGRYDWIDAWAWAPAVTLVTVEASQGLDVLGARRTGSDGLSVAGGRSDFFKVTAEATRTQRLDEDFSLLAGLTGQWAASTLLSAEQFSLGGGQYGRGYDPAEIAGDHGIGAKLELRCAGPEIPAVDSWQIYGFWDGGRVWPADPHGAGQAHDIASAGLGLRAALADRAGLTLELAKPLTHPLAVASGDGGKGPRGFLSLTVRY